MKKILKCKECAKYTLTEDCSCGAKSVPVGPAKFSPQDSYAKYRRQAKRPQLEEAGLL